MANDNDKLIYSIALGDSKMSDNETSIFRSMIHPGNLISNFDTILCYNGWDIFNRGAIMNSGKNKCLGYRKKDPITGIIEKEFSWLSYSQVKRKSLLLGTAISSLPDAANYLEFPDEEYEFAKKIRFIGILSKNKIEWLITEQAANAYNFALVPLYDSFEVPELSYIIEKTQLVTVVSSMECLPRLLQAAENTHSIKHIILISEFNENISDETQNKISNLGITLSFFDKLIEDSNANVLPATPGTINQINTVCYTSGTTGKPKGVLLTNKNLVSCVASLIKGSLVRDVKLSENDVSICYLPLAHVLERCVCNSLMALGGYIGVYSGDTLKLLEDCQSLNPTLFVSVPRVYNRISNAVFRGVSQKSFFLKYLFNTGMSSKLTNLHNNSTMQSFIWDKLVFNKCKKLLSSNLRLMISGGAPLDAKVNDEMKILFCAPLVEGYGLTESFGPVLVTDSKDSLSGHVGGLVPCNEFKLISVPEMKYFVSDNPPRGELLIRGNSITVGYFRSKELTDEVIDKDGWFYTGDIVLLLPGGSVKIIDRKKNIFKLAQGEYVCPEKIEGVYSHVSLISQIFVYGYSEKAFPVAIVVPDNENIKLWVEHYPKYKSLNYNELCRLDILKTDILKKMNEVAKKMNLKGYEKVKGIHITHEEFSINNDLLTQTTKIKRLNAKTFFQKEIDALYEEIEKTIV